MLDRIQSIHWYKIMGESHCFYYFIAKVIGYKANLLILEVGLALRRSLIYCPILRKYGDFWGKLNFGWDHVSSLSQARSISTCDLKIVFSKFSKRHTFAHFASHQIMVALQKTGAVAVFL